MANLTIDATAGGTSSNSYITLAEARTEARRHIDGDRFLALPEEDQIQALVNAAQNLDGLKYLGSKYSDDQRLAFPRDVTPDAADDNNDTDSGEIPDVIKIVQVMEAIAMACGYRPERGGSKDIAGVKYYAAGGPLASKQVLQILNVYGWVQAPANLKISSDVL